MSEMIRTSFSTEANHEKNERLGEVALEKFLSASQEVQPFTDEEKNLTVQLLKKIQQREFKEHEKSPKPIVHLTFGTGTVTGVMITESIPEEFQEFYERIAIVPVKSKMDLDKNLSAERKKLKETAPERIIFLQEDGTILNEDNIKLTNTLKGRAGIIIGGGPYSPGDPVYKPVIRALGDQLEKEPTTIGGICLGHQLMGLLMGAKRGTYVKDEWTEHGPAIEEVTDKGRQHPITGRFGKSYVSVMAHDYEIDFPDAQSYYEVLTKSLATNEPISVSYNEKGIRAITSQSHHEWGIALSSDPSPVVGPVYVEVKGKRIQILKEGERAHHDMIYQAKYLAEDFSELSKILPDFSEKVFVDLLNPARVMAKNLGGNFFGPLIMEMAKNKLRI